MLQRTSSTVGYFYNQSEASNFIAIWPYLLVPSLYAILKRFRITWQTLLMYSVAGLILARLWLTPPDWLLRLFQIHNIPHPRLLLALGLIGLLQMLALWRVGFRAPRLLAAASAVIATGLQLIVGQTIIKLYPTYLSTIWPVIICSGAVGIIIYLALRRQMVAAAGLLLLLSLASTAAIHPIYRGLTPLTNSRLAEAVEAVDAESPGPWVVIDASELTNFVPALGISSFSATYAYPQPDLWKRFDPDPARFDVYNRYAFALFTVRPLPSGLVENTPDSFYVRYDPCEGATVNIKHALAREPIESSCLELTRIVEYPAQTFYLYTAK
jgi:hypothetical protein